jgi:hypothetical protein
MKTKMKFSIILSIDIYDKGWKLSAVKPEIVKHPLFYKTESEADEDCVKIHRKYCGTLSIDELYKLIEQINITSSCDTQGALTLEYGFMPAISLTDDDGGYTINLYVSPIFDDETEEKIQKVLGNITEGSKNIIVDTVTGPHFDRAMELLKEIPDYDDENFEELRNLSEKDLDIQPMLPFKMK